MNGTCNGLSLYFSFIPSNQYMCSSICASCYISPKHSFVFQADEYGTRIQEVMAIAEIAIKHPDKLYLLQDIDSLRGLEHLTSKEVLLLRRYERLKTSHSVLSEQLRQREEGRSSATRIAFASSRFTMQAKQRAIEEGLADARAATQELILFSKDATLI